MLPPSNPFSMQFQTINCAKAAGCWQIFFLASNSLTDILLQNFGSTVICHFISETTYAEGCYVSSDPGLQTGEESMHAFSGVHGSFKGSIEAGESTSSYVKGSYHLYAVLGGLLSSTFGGVSYCFIRAAAKAADQPVLTVFAFGLFASPAAAICTFAFEGFVLPGFYTLLLMVVLGSLAFFAEITIAHALQLEKTSKVVNILYLEAASSQLLGMSLSRIVPTFGRLVGCSLILISACCTMYIGPEKEVE